MIYKEDVKIAAVGLGCVAVATVLIIWSLKTFFPPKHRDTVIPEEAYIQDEHTYVVSPFFDSAGLRKEAEQKGWTGYAVRYGVDKEDSPYYYHYFRRLNQGDSFRIFRVKRGFIYRILATRDEWFALKGTSGRFIDGDLYLTGEESPLKRNSAGDTLEEVGAENEPGKQSVLHLTDAKEFEPHLK